MSARTLLCLLILFQRVYAQNTTTCYDSCILTFSQGLSTCGGGTSDTAIISCFCASLGQQLINCIAPACAATDEAIVEELIISYRGACGSNPTLTGSFSSLLTATAAASGQVIPGLNLPTVGNTITTAGPTSMASALSVSSVSSELAAQTRTGNANPNSINTATVAASDPRINYQPSSSWVDTSTQSGVGSCNNGTKVTQDAQAKFTFVFQGTDISLNIVPSPSGGAFTAQIDGEPAESLSSLKSGGSTSSNQCITSKPFTKSGLANGAHELTVINGGVTGSSAGTLEVSSIIYTGKGAFGQSAIAVSGSSRRSAFIDCVSAALVGTMIGLGIFVF